MGNQLTTNSDSDDEDDKVCWAKYFFPCFRTRKRPVDFGFFDLNEYDYVVEKLAIKYVKVSLFATTYDSYEYSKNNHQSIQNTSTVLTASVQASPILPTSLPKPEFSSKTMRKLRFSKQDSSGVRSDSIKKPSLAHSIGGTSPAAELMSSLTAFHPHLKESERSPKDPYSLNITKSQRSFAEELSEIAARKNNNNNNNSNNNQLSDLRATETTLTPGTSKQL